MEGTKITIITTEEDGKQTVINSDFAIICAHAEGEPNNDMKALCCGAASIMMIANAYNDFADLIARIAAADPKVATAIMLFGKQTRNRDVQYERFEMAGKETANEANS